MTLNNFSCHDNYYYGLVRGHLQDHSQQYSQYKNYFIHTRTLFSGTITWRLHSLVMVGIDTHFVLLKVEGILAGVNSPQLMVTVKVRPSP